MKSEEIPNEAIQSALEGFNSWYGARAEILHHTDLSARVKVEMYHMDSEDRAGMVYELVESGWVLESLSMEQKTVTARGSMEQLPSYWTE